MSTYHNGLAAEEIAAKLYTDRGGQICAQRWRKRGGEIDLIVEQDGLLIFVEVKARKTLDKAAHALLPAQQKRIMQTAELYLAETGRPLNTNMRFDLVSVDQFGAYHILENALAEGW